MNPSIKEVAKEAGVSIATVSRALNGEGYVSECSYKKVVLAAKKLNYVPNYFAKSLLKQKTNIIGVIVSDIETSFFAKILKNIERCASDNNYNIMICNIDTDLEKEKKYLNIFNEMCVDGIVLTHEKTNEKIVRQFAKMERIPIVACSCFIEDFNFSSINIDDYKAAYDAIKYLVRLGNKKIAYFGSVLDEFTVGRKRYNGVKDAIKDSGIVMPEKYIKLSGLRVANGAQMAKELVKECRDDMPTAIFAGSDELAVGVLNCLLDFGYKVPEDISILGFDDSEISVYTRPSISTVHQPIDEIGYCSVGMLIDLIENKQTEPKNIILPHRIIERESCRRV